MALTTVPSSLSATAITLTTAAQPNITSVGTLTGLTVSGNIAGTLTTAAQTNITSVGTLTGLAVTGDTTITKESPAFTLTDSSSSRTLLHFVDDNNSVVRASGPLLLQSGGAVTALTLDASQDATFGGTGTFAGGAANNNDDANILTLNASQHARLLVDTSSTGGHRATLALESNGNELTLATTGSASYLNSVGALGIDGGKVDINKVTSFSAYPAGSQLNVYANGEGIRLDGTGATSRNIRFRNVSDANPGVIIADGSLKLETEDANTDIRLSAIRDIEYQVTSTNSTAGHHIFKSHNTEIMRIDGQHNRVGIGISSGMDRDLHIKGSGSDPGIQIEKTGSHELRVAVDSTGPYLYAEGTAPLRFYQNNAETVRISDNNVGIGTTNPTKKLHIIGDSNEGIHLKAGAQVPYTPTSSTFYSGLTFENAGSAHAFSIAYGQGGWLKFSHFDNASTYSELAQLRSSGDFYPAGSVVMASGEGINFSATGQATGMSGELLDDYEEGTWTPLLIAGTTNPTGGGALSPYGSYTKVGNRVTVTYYVGRSYTNTPAGQIYVSGLPFTIKDVVGNVQYHYVATYNVNFNGGMTMGVPDRGASTFNLYAVQNSGTWTQIDWTSHTSSPIYLSGSFSYIVD